ncbi:MULTISPECIES: 2-amino-4-hydroxy-6-hydroxymethyldihydropteridine diphosphokinase [unclassified Virgibacillus]|uniref:2-amino-4-hydroxy-6- hydroxymethyldihydropteridine diphosphokinase n=1 Tax=unclassified Virgibacillus TaxID=2620237 RepID=UPI0024DE3596|nr:2-amino-4-hydroxy-6-hydroxymethyldihydropteridine diphosphokinase [Virgibacillus sp. LDC-1]
MNKAFIALGTNIEPRFRYLSEAMERLAAHRQISVCKESLIYETEPVGYKEQADFLNKVIAVETTLSAIELLDVCQTIENELGRKREIRFGPRTIDLDILYYNNENIKTERLIVPHPRMMERAFVLIPLLELVPELVIGETFVKTLLAELPESDKKGVKKWTQDELAGE